MYVYLYIFEVFNPEVLQYTNQPVSINGIPQCRKTEQRLNLCSGRAWGWPIRSKHVAM